MNECPLRTSSRLKAVCQQSAPNRTLCSVIRINSRWVDQRDRVAIQSSTLRSRIDSGCDPEAMRRS
jgi:hypothetical protein